MLFKKFCPFSFSSWSAYHSPSYSFSRLFIPPSSSSLSKTRNFSTPEAQTRLPPPQVWNFSGISAAPISRRMTTTLESLTRISNITSHWKTQLLWKVQLGLAETKSTSSHTCGSSTIIQPSLSRKAQDSPRLPPAAISVNMQGKTGATSKADSSPAHQTRSFPLPAL